MKLNDLAQALRSTHSTLLEVVKNDYEAKNGAINGPFAYFQLVTNDPAFQWLRPLSGMMALLDDLLDNKRDLKPSDAQDIRIDVEKLFTDPGVSEFASHFEARVLTQGEVKTRQGELMSTLLKLSDP
jgi:hypothetical protein